jgi:2-polyprenyl-3-methyl-5-hydroxy-6-metoxy-1,4-benzoquinol methylase
MTPMLQVVLVAAIVLFVVGTVWRIASRRSSLPCPSWLAWLVEVDNPFFKNYNAGEIVERLDLQPGMKILDAGCGPGRVSIPLAKAAGGKLQVVALDMQPRMLQRAKEKARAAGLENITFIEAAIESANLGSGEYDRAILVTVLGEIPDRQAALREIHRTLKPGGILSITEIMFDPHYQGRKTILELAGPVGFRQKSLFGNRFAFTILLDKVATQ